MQNQPPSNPPGSPPIVVGGPGLHRSVSILARLRSPLVLGIAIAVVAATGAAAMFIAFKPSASPSAQHRSAGDKTTPHHAATGTGGGNGSTPAAQPPSTNKTTPKPGASTSSGTGSGSNTSSGSVGGSSGGGTSGGTTPSGWPDATNTGYQNAPGYPGHLTTYSATTNGTECSGPLQSNTTYHYCDFIGSGTSAAATIGSVGNIITNITFYGCHFASNATDNANITVANAVGVTFDYATIEPKLKSTPPVTYNQGYQYGINQTLDDRPTNFLHGYTITVDHTNMWGFGNGMQLGYSNQSKPITVRNSWFHDARDDGGIDHTDAILDNDGGADESYMTFDHNTIASVGNTNGLALQYGGGGNYDHITVTSNYFSGFGYTVNIGGAGHLTNSVFTDNTFGTDFAPIFGPLYGWGGSGNLWRRNKIHFINGTSVEIGSHTITAADDGKYWWPDDTVSSTDYSGS